MNVDVDVACDGWQLTWRQDEDDDNDKVFLAFTAVNMATGSGQVERLKINRSDRTSYCSYSKPLYNDTRYNDIVQTWH